MARLLRLHARLISALVSTVPSREEPTKATTRRYNRSAAISGRSGGTTWARSSSRASVDRSKARSRRYLLGVARSPAVWTDRRLVDVRSYKRLTL
jgi:hypothetical protein